MAEVFPSMEKLLDASCLHCKAINPNGGEKQFGRIAIPYKRVDQYPSFPMLLTSFRKGCGFCGLLRHALQDQYSDEKTSNAESDFAASIRANWHTSEWDRQVTVDSAAFYTEEGWPERDVDQVSDPTLGGVYVLSFKFWPYPPRRNDIEPEHSCSSIFFQVYNGFGK